MGTMTYGLAVSKITFEAPGSRSIALNFSFFLYKLVKLFTSNSISV
jgi:hypothetical protein